MNLLILFFTFFKIGLISFGGGYAMIPFLQYEAVSRGWLTNEEIIDMVGMSQITPGPIATNMATFVGYSEYGLIGAIVATIGVSLPSIILVILVMKYILSKVNDENREILFSGLQPVVVSLIAISCLSLGQSIFIPNGIQSVEWISVVLTVFCFFMLVKYKTSSIKLIIFSAIIGVFLY